MNYSGNNLSRPEFFKETKNKQTKWYCIPFFLSGGRPFKQKEANTLGREEDHLNKKRPIHWLSLDTFEVNSASPDGRDPRVDILEIFLYL